MARKSRYRKVINVLVDETLFDAIGYWCEVERDTQQNFCRKALVDYIRFLQKQTFDNEFAKELHSIPSDFYRKQQTPNNEENDE